MDFKSFLEYRADEDCPVGVIAHDLLENDNFPFADTDVRMLQAIDLADKPADIEKNWLILKSEFLAQKD